MSTQNICFCGEVRKISILLDEKKTPSYQELWMQFDQGLPFAILSACCRH